MTEQETILKIDRLALRPNIKSPDEMLRALKARPSTDKWPKPNPSKGWAAEYDAQHFPI